MSEPTHLELAQLWLDAWAANGGGVTIAASGLLHPWRHITIGDHTDIGKRCARAEIAEKLLGQLLIAPDIHQPIRVILNTKARGMAAPFLKGQKP